MSERSSPPAQLAALERELAELNASLPAHSIPPALMQRIDEIEEALAALRPATHTPQGAANPMSKKVNHASATWKADGLKFEGAAGSGFTLDMDGAPGSGGEGAGFRPMEMLLVGLAGCTGMDVISILRKKRQDVTGFAVNVKGTRADDHPRAYTNIEIDYVVTGHGIDPKAVERAVELSETKYCGASATLGGIANITSTYEVKEVE
jgi:putative redox protein